MEPQEKRVCFVVNPKSGGGRTAALWGRLEPALRESIGEIGVKKTGGVGDGMRLTREAVAEGYRLIVSVGGDGTNNEVVNGLLGSDGKLQTPGVAFSFLPSGSGCDLQRTLPASARVEAIVTMIQKGEQKHLDVGEIHFVDRQGQAASRFFLNIASFGVSGLVLQYIEHSKLKRWSGKLAFYLASMRAFFRFKNVALRLRLGEEAEEEAKTAHLVTICNGRAFGGGMLVAPDAKMDDGLFEIVALGDLSSWELMRGLPKVYKGAHLSLPKVSHQRAASLHVEAATEVWLDIDGEALGRLPASFVLHPGVLPYQSFPTPLVV